MDYLPKEITMHFREALKEEKGWSNLRQTRLKWKKLQTPEERLFPLQRMLVVMEWRICGDDVIVVLVLVLVLVL